MRVAIVSPHPVFPANSGDRVRTSQLLSGLRAAGVDAHLVAWNWTRELEPSPWPSEFMLGKPLTPLRWLAWRLRFNVRRRTDPLAAYHMAHEAANLAPLVRRLQPDVVDFQHSYTWMPTGIPDVCTFHNIETHLVQRVGMRNEASVEAVRLLEQRVLRSVGVAVTFSEVDARRARALAPDGAPVVSVPLGHRPVGAPRKTAHAQRLKTAIFVGTLSYGPNAQAARLLVDMWPQLQRDVGLERLLIVGRDAGGCVRSGAGIEVIPDVESVAPYLVNADVTLVPLVSGGGVRVKIIEAFALGVPVVSTRVGIEGLEAEDGVHAVIVDDPSGIPAGLERLQSAQERAVIAENAYQLWKSTYSPEQMVASMVKVYDSVLRGLDHSTPSTRAIS